MVIYKDKYKIETMWQAQKWKGVLSEEILFIMNSKMCSQGIGCLRTHSIAGQKRKHTVSGAPQICGICTTTTTQRGIRMPVKKQQIVIPLGYDETSE